MGAFLLRFFLMGGFFHNLKAFLLLFHVGAFCYVCLLMEGPFSPFKSLPTTFFSSWGPFCYVFLLMRGFFHYLKAFLLLFFPCRAFLLRFSPLFFSPFKGLSATFFLYVEAFLLCFSPYGGLFFPFKCCFATFFSMCGCCFCFDGETFFGLPPPPHLPNFWQVPMPACPLTPMSNMQYNHSLTASCHFCDILKIVTKYFLIYIFA